MQPIEMTRVMCEEVYGKGKTELIPQLVSDNYVGHDPIRGRMDRATTETDVKTYRRAFPDLTMQAIDIFESGDKVMLRWRATGTHKGELFGAQPTNRKVTVEGISESRIVNGKIQESWAHWDTLGLLRQIGMVPELPIVARPDGGARPPMQEQSRR